VEVYSSYKAALVFAGGIVFLALLVMLCGRLLTMKQQAALENILTIKTQSNS